MWNFSDPTSPIEVVLLKFVAIVVQLFTIPETTRRPDNLNSALPEALSFWFSYTCSETPLMCQLTLLPECRQ
jgi:hypothetical protein